MRSVSSGTLAALNTDLGTEPINILEIQWVTGGARDTYADRDMPGVKGKILSVDNLDNVINVAKGSQSQKISVVLDDHDGTIKAILDSIDIHKKPCWVYQWFDGLDLDDKFLLFRGDINSPVEWNEGDRTIRFDVVSRIEDVEIGFSIEEGDFVSPPEDLIGKPWPLCFGTVVNIPALQVQAIRQGTLATGVGIRDFMLSRKLQAANLLTCPSNLVGIETEFIGGSGTGTFKYLPDEQCTRDKCVAIESLTLSLTEQRQYEYTTIRVFGGEKFPQNTSIVLDINGGKFRGVFNGDIFTITARRHPKNDGSNNIIQDEQQTIIDTKCNTRRAVQESILDRFSGGGNDNDGIVLGAKQSRATWDAYNAIELAGFFWANAGAKVTLSGDEEIIYIANIIPSTILRVAAWRTLEDHRQLLTVPDNYYTIRQVDYTGYQVMEIVFPRPLSSRAEGWDDDIYVTMTSSVGPNTVDILEWIIGTYSDYDIDATSFNDVRTKIDNYPMHFPILDRRNLIQVLSEIAYQARCALWLKDGVFFIKYLAEEPTPDDTIVEDDILVNELVVTHTPTEDLITKFVAEWRFDYAREQPNKLILRHNVNKYGTHEQTTSFYCFNILELVRKAATFWLIRRANTWRLAQFKTTLSKLRLEVFDTVELTLPDVGDGAIKAIVESAQYNSEDNSIDFEVWTPIKSGTRTPYNFAYPALVEELALFPTYDERSAGAAGSGQHPNFTTIAPPTHPLRRPGFTGINIQDRADHGDPHPSDIGDIKPTPNAAQDQTGLVGGGTTSPIAGPDACAEARRIAEQALAEAQEARREAQTGRSTNA